MAHIERIHQVVFHFLRNIRECMHRLPIPGDDKQQDSSETAFAEYIPACLEALKTESVVKQGLQVP